MSESYAEAVDQIATSPPLIGRTGVGITPVLCSGKEWGPLQGGLDQVEVSVGLTQLGKVWLQKNTVMRPTRYGRFLVGSERGGRWDHFLGVPTIYDPRQGSLAFDFHPHERGHFAPLDGWMETVSGELNRRAGLGLEFEGWPIVKRADVGIDVGFANPEVGRAFYEGLRDRRYTKARRVQERQPGWFAILGRGTRRPVLHGRVYDKGVESRLGDPWRWIRTERVIRWERKEAIRLALLTTGALRHAYDEVFLDGLEPGTLIRASNMAQRLADLVAQEVVTLRQYEELTGYLTAEHSGTVEGVFGGRPDLVSRRRALARRVGFARDGATATSDVAVDLHQVMVEARVALESSASTRGATTITRKE